MKVCFKPIKPTVRQLQWRHQPIFLPTVTSCCTTQQVTSSTHLKNTLTPWPPPAAGFQRLQNNRWVRSPNIAWWRTISTTRRCNFVKWKKSFYIITRLVPRAADQQACRQKVCFLSEYTCFFIVRCIESTRTNPSCTRIFFCRCVSCPRHVLTWFFRQGGRTPWLGSL